MLATDFTCVSGGDENAPLLNRTQSPDTTNPTLGVYWVGVITQAIPITSAWSGHIEQGDAGIA